MHIIVFVRQAAVTRYYSIDSQGRLKEDDMGFELNESDRYAMEEALLTKERLGGSITAVAVGPPNRDKILKECLALGADEAIRVWDEAIADSDSCGIARVLSAFIKTLSFDLILTGSQDDHDLSMHIAPLAAHILGIPYATIVCKLTLSDGVATVHRELENGIEEILEMNLPVLLTVQTGINVTRYTSLSGMMKAKKIPIQLMDLAGIGLNGSDVGSAGSQTDIEKCYLPQVAIKASILKGSADETAQQLVNELKQKGAL